MVTQHPIELTESEIETVNGAGNGDTYEPPRPKTESVEVKFSALSLTERESTLETN